MSQNNELFKLTPCIYLIIIILLEGYKAYPFIF